MTREQRALDEKEAAGQEVSGTKKRKSAQTKPVQTEAEIQYTIEMNALDDWLQSYKQSKMDETQIAQATYDEQVRKFNDLLTEQKISYDEFTDYMADAEADLNLKLYQIKESAATDARALAKAQNDEQIAKWAEEQRRIEEEKAKAMELQEYKWQLQETAAAGEEERISIQKERMNARYDEQVEKAKENAELLNGIERARTAEMERLENQLFQTRLNVTEQYAKSMMQVANGVAVIGKAGGDKMKAIAISEAIINTALAATKAMTTAPWPLNLALAAGATASGMAQVATIKSQKFAKGGIVESNSYYGDSVPVMANSGEMILNKEQQKTLLNIANNKETDNRPQVNITFAPNISPGTNAEDVKKMLRENQSLFRSFLANEVSRGLSSAGAFT